MRNILSNRTTYGLLIFALALAAVVLLWTGGVAPRAQAQADSVALVMQPATATVQVGEPVTVTVQVQAGEQEVDAVGAFINFDPSALQVISITTAGPMTTVLEDEFDNSAGTIDYQAGKLGAPFPSGTFALATIRFEAVATSAGTDVNFSDSSDRETRALRAGKNVLDTTTGSTIIVVEESTVTSTAIATATDTSTATPTSTSVTASATPTTTATDMGMGSPTPTATDTATLPAQTATATAPTTTPTATATNTPTDVDTGSPTPTSGTSTPPAQTATPSVTVTATVPSTGTPVGVGEEDQVFLPLIRG